jgi:hypothetical protein
MRLIGAVGNEVQAAELASLCLRNAAQIENFQRLAAYQWRRHAHGLGLRIQPARAHTVETGKGELALAA